LRQLHVTDPAKIAAEVKWLIDHPDFEERPATLEEFLGPEYLDIYDRVRKSILQELRTIMGDQVSAVRPTAYELAMITGGIGIGKTTIASIVLPYLAHWVLCLKDPQKFFGLLPGSRIALMMMSTSESQAREVLFGDVKARIGHSKWFKKYPYDSSFKNQIRFAQKDIWIVPGDSAETTFEGYNILGGILDEADSHKVTANKDYADVGYDAINSRISSRFQDRGFLLVIGQMKKAVGFAARKYNEFKANPKAHAVKLTIWESMGDDFYRDENGDVLKFAYDVKRKQIIPSGAAQAIGPTETIIWVPELYRKQFETNPEKALRDLAGIPPNVGDPFISLTYKIEEAQQRWINSHPGDEPPVDKEGRVHPAFAAPDSLKRVAHLDIAYSGNGDALGLAMGHVPRMVERDGEIKPYICIDFLLRMKAQPGGVIYLSDVRRILYHMRDGLRFKLDMVTMDGFQSTDTEQQLRKRRFRTDYVSVDREVLPYHDLREALYEDRIEFPPYIVTIRKESGNDDVDILYKELTELVDEGRKIDHPIDGSKDVADAVAGVTFTLMGDRRYRKRMLDMSNELQRQETKDRRSPFNHPAVRGDFSPPSAPLPPTLRR
jgi:hypothetical protein